MAKCRKCGREISDGEKYCAACTETKDHEKKHWIKTLGTAGIIVVAIIGYLTGRNK